MTATDPPRAPGPPPKDAPKRAPKYPSYYKRIWIPMVGIYVVWTPLLLALLYARIKLGMPTGWYVPLLIGLILAAIVPGAAVVPVWFARLQGRVTRAQGMLCPNCLYDLRDLPAVDLCPECGWAFEGSTPPEIWARTLHRNRPYDPPPPHQGPPPDRPAGP